MSHSYLIILIIYITIEFRDDPKPEEPRSLTIATNVVYKPEIATNVVYKPEIATNVVYKPEIATAMIDL